MAGMSASLKEIAEGFVPAEEGGRGGEGGEVGESACSHSFRGDTAVEMADGSRKPIEAIEMGDVVRATDPVAGTVFLRTVTFKHINLDFDLLDLFVDTPAGVRVIHTTVHHRFWNDTNGTWVEAADLVAGSRLLSGDGEEVVIVRTDSIIGSAVMYDLTVDETHTYRVYAGDVPVVVHNQTAGGAGRNDPHGDGGRAMTKAEARIAELEAQIKPGMPRAERVRIENTIKNIRQNAARAAKGETHGRTGKGC
jgi:Pretoxin HINT domain